MNDFTINLICLICLLVVGLLPVGIGFLVAKNSDGDIAIKKLGVNYIYRAFILDVFCLIAFFLLPGREFMVNMLLLAGIVLNVTLFKFRK